MALFFLLIALMTLIALAFVVIPLFYSLQKKEISNTDSSIIFYQQQLQLLEKQFEKAEISQKEYHASCDELGKILLQEASHFSPAFSTASTPRLAIILFLFIPLLAILLYWHWGYASALSQFFNAKQQNSLVQAEIKKLGSVQNIITVLQQKIAQNPHDSQGWYLLGKLYLSQQKFEKAADAFSRAYQLNAANAQIQFDYAQSLFFVNHEQLTPLVKILFNQVIKADPQNFNALNLLAIGEYHAKDYSSAIQHWEKLLTQFPPDSHDAKEILAMIAKAEQQLTRLHLQ